MGTVHAKDASARGHLKAVKGSSLKNDTINKSLAHDHDRTENKELDLNTVAARVDRVHIDGIVRTKDDFIKRSVNDLFGVSNFKELLRSAHLVRKKLIELGCFKSVSIQIDTSTGPNSTNNGFEVTFLVEELKRISGTAMTELAPANNEGVVSIFLNMPNMFGCGEQLSGVYKYGTRKSRNFDITYKKPMLSAWNLKPSASIYQNESDWPSSGYKTTNRGISGNIFFTSRNNNLEHNLLWEGVWRNLGVGSKSASFYVRERSGHSLKSCIKHIMCYDKRDSIIFPTHGSFMKLTTEIAGFGGNTKFFKNELNIQINRPVVSNDFVIQATFNAGVVNPLSKDDIHLCDKFYLGGPMNFRGFDFRGVGPKEDENFVGGEYYWSGALHLFSPLPFKPGSGGFGEFFKTHLFMNIGNLGNFSNDSTQSWIEEQKKFRLACGLGIAFALRDMARIEVNYCFPLRYHEKDNRTPGFQLGAGVIFN